MGYVNFTHGGDGSNARDRSDSCGGMGRDSRLSSRRWENWIGHLFPFFTVLRVKLEAFV